ncbi:hypothetical protein HZA39_00525 [Candidatus Peregrinibacteria bacterium]|nr:hypothetical protein [Candidatus Peregrinibacteria bacterium]
MSNNDPSSINIPAFMRKKGLDTRLKDKLLNTAYDYKQVGKLGKLAKEISRTRPLLKAKPLRKNLDFNAFGETPIKKRRKRHAAKKSTQFEMPLIGFNETAAEEFDAPIVEEAIPAYRRPTGVVNKFAADAVNKFAADAVKIVPIGTISDYLQRIEVGIIELDAVLREGDIIQIECGDGMFQQTADSIQINRKQVKLARKGASIGLKLVEMPEIGGRVFKVI